MISYKEQLRKIHNFFYNQNHASHKYLLTYRDSLCGYTNSSTLPRFTSIAKESPTQAIYNFLSNNNTQTAVVPPITF